MPRGHELLAEDAEHVRNFTGQYGVHPNAEALLAAHRANLDPALEAASGKQIDGDATAKLDLSKIEPERGGVILSASVRGNAIVYVAEGEDGRTYKGMAPYNKSYAPPAEDPNEAAGRAAMRKETEYSHIAAVVNMNVEAEVEAFRAKLNEQAAEVLAKAREDLNEDAVKAAEEARSEAEAAKGKAGTDESPAKGASPPSDPAQGGGPKQAKGGSK